MIRLNLLKKAGCYCRRQGRSEMAKQSFETALKKLEEVVGKLESGEVSLDQSLKLFEQGITLVRQCSKRLDEVESKVQVLVSDERGERLEEFS